MLGSSGLPAHRGDGTGRAEAATSVMQEHLTRELFRAIAGGWRKPGDMAAIAMAHLFELCPRCRREFESWRAELESRDVGPEGADYEAVLDRIRERVEPPSEESRSGASESPLDGDLREARSRAEELLRLDPEQQLAWIRSEADRLAGPLLAEVLIEEGRRRTPGYPHDGYTLTRLARLVLQHAPASLHSAKLYARALAYMANAVRVTGDLPRADQILGDARFFLRSQAGGDRLVRAELDKLEGSLRRDQDRPREAVAVLLRAQMVYRLEGLDSDTAATLLLLCRAHEDLEELDRAFQLLDEADKLLGASPAPRLRFASVLHRACLLHKSGSTKRALDVLIDNAEHLARDADPVDCLRWSWRQGLVSGTLGDFDEKEQGLLRVIDGFASRRMIHDIAWAQLDLAGLYIEQGRFKEVEDLAERAAATFEGIGMPHKVAEARRLSRCAANG